MDEADRYPLYNGDSIGFWDGDKLVIHPNQLRAGIYQRRNPDYTDEVETVEIWQKVDPKLIEVDVWVYDAPALVEPWYTKQSYAKLDDQGKSLRIRYWHSCLYQSHHLAAVCRRGVGASLSNDVRADKVVRVVRAFNGRWRDNGRGRSVPGQRFETALIAM